MKNQDIATLLKPHNDSTIELIEMSEKEFRSLLWKMIDLKWIQINNWNEVRKSIQDLEKKVSKMDKKFIKEMEIMKKSRNIKWKPQ
jgi:hypothetical protein